jgi:peptidoglycan hydrolase-like protein with peptidoglycan-binding domain
MVAISARRPTLRKGIENRSVGEANKTRAAESQKTDKSQLEAAANAANSNTEAQRPQITAETRAFAWGRAQERELLNKARIPGWAGAPTFNEVGAGLAEMKRGMGGASVAQLQTKLNEQGANLDVDGKFGPLTENALRQAQARQGMPATGRLDARTLQNISGETRGLGDPVANQVPENISGWNQAPNLDQIQTTNARMRRGMGGRSVAQIQEMLNRNGAHLDVDGKFGGQTERALLNFQQTRGLPDNASVGPRTLQALRTDAPAVNAPAANDNAESPQATGNVNASTAGMTEAQKYDHYRSLIQQNGGQFKDGPNQRNLVALRNTTDADTNRGKGRYDDTMAMIWTDRQGRKRVREYTMNTEPSAQYRGRVGVDANGDGRKDQGRLGAGYYEYRTGSSSRLGRVLRPTANQMAERDTNHDGLFNDGARASAGQSILFHGGGYSNVSSAGCQTFAPDVYNRFWRDLHSGGNPGTVGYTLINAG